MISTLLYGVLQLPWWGYVIATLTLTQITIFSVTIYLHRYSAHRALELHPIVCHFFRFWLWLTTTMVTKEWTAIHRKHHARVETTEDPHSPQIVGIRKVLLEGAELYGEEAKNPDTLERFGQGTPDDWIERNLYTPHCVWGAVLMMLIDLTLFGLAGVIVWAIQMAWIPFWAAGVVNGLAHFWGYRNFESPDASRNLIPIAFFIGGEELHNNHHTYGTSAKFSVHWWEFDMGWAVIRGLQFFGLARAKRVPPKIKLMPQKTRIDQDTLKSVVTNRFQLMAQYSKEVILPTLVAERKRATDSSRALLSRAYGILVREISLLKASHKAALEKILSSSQKLRTVYDFRMRLQEIWSRNTANPKELIEALQEWCKQAEATRIDVLSNFSRRLKMCGG